MFKAESSKQNHLEGGGPPVVRSVRQPRVGSRSRGKKEFDEYRKKVDVLAEESRELVATWERTRGTLDYSVNDNLEELALNLARQRLAVRVANWSEEDYIIMPTMEEINNTRGRSRTREPRSPSPLPASDAHGVRPSRTGRAVEERESITTIDVNPSWMKNALAEGAPVLTGFDIKAALASKNIWDVKEKLYEVHDLAAQQETTLDDLFQEMTRMMNNNHYLANKLIDREKELEAIKEAFLIATEGHGDASTVVNDGVMAIMNGDDVITNSDDDIAHASASETSEIAVADPHSHLEPVSTGRTPPMGPRLPLPLSVSEARRECYRRYSGLDVGVEDAATMAEEGDRGNGEQERPQGMPTVDGGIERSRSSMQMPADGAGNSVEPVKDDAEGGDKEVAATQPPLFATPLPHPGQFVSARFRTPKNTNISVDGRALRDTKSAAPFGGGRSNPFGAGGGGSGGQNTSNGNVMEENEGITVGAVAEHHAAEVDGQAAGNKHVFLTKENGKGVAIDDGVSSCTSYNESVISYRSSFNGIDATGNPQTGAGIGNGGDVCGEGRIGADGAALGGERKVGGETRGFSDAAVGDSGNTNGVPNEGRASHGEDTLWGGVQGTCEDYFDGGV